MATQIKKNEAVVLPLYKNGVTLQFFTITFPGSVAGLETASAAGVKSPIVQAIEAIATVASIELIGTVSTTTLPLAVAALGGPFGTATWNGTNNETFAAYLQRLIQAAGGTSIQGIDNATTTVAAGVRGQTF